jgi:hypothetical protein
MAQSRRLAGTAYHDGISLNFQGRKDLWLSIPEAEALRDLLNTLLELAERQARRLPLSPDTMSHVTITVKPRNTISHQPPTPLHAEEP